MHSQGGNHPPRQKGKRRLSEALKTRTETTRRLLRNLHGGLQGVSVNQLETALRSLEGAPDGWWKDTNMVRKMATQFAQSLHMSIPEDRLNALIQTYEAALRNQPQTIDPVKLAEMYGQGKIDVDKLRDMKRQIEQSRRNS
ncbi:hypothetical protein Alches_23700 [Alicyclobacillus hesperidum subsp. aegles]|uniref:hypothetical protein n=1 Tax=Alicyclobacillus hesperidum TaxID=89784 RepID=UPI00222893AB|nr:hypothetical protein [Alicyclobacillus hesperidum]GLG02329.1 hypothetical protein Alches_23700 [Alicyclobacillus hesperidum subsp. aegles]